MVKLQYETHQVYNAIWIFHKTNKILVIKNGNIEALDTYMSNIIHKSGGKKYKIQNLVYVLKKNIKKQL